MSFFDEDDDAPRPPRPRRPAPVRSVPPDQQQLMVRRAVALGIGVLMLILLVVGVRSCLNSRTERALRDYNREVSALVRESDTQISKPFFDLLAAGSANSPLDLGAQINQLRVAAGGLVDRARGFDVPDDMAPAQEHLLNVLELRRDALGEIAQRLPTALGDEGAAEAVTGITAQMQAFLASDVLYSQRVIPFIQRALADHDIGGERIENSRFLPNLDWLDENFVAERLDASVQGGRGADGEPAPGTHGHGLVAVTAGGVTLQPEVANRVPATADLSFEVRFQNQGENDEVDVVVRVRVSGSGEPLTAERTIDRTTAGQETTVSIPLPEAPPIGTPVTVTVEVRRVPGERTADNNRQRYPVIFTR